MYLQKSHYMCYKCRKHTKDVLAVYMDNAERWMCIRCFLAHVLHEVVKEMLINGDEEEFKHAIRVLEGINDLVEDNPLTQAIRYTIDLWSHKYPDPLFLNELKEEWKYGIDLNKVISYLASEGILTLINIELTGGLQVVISPSDVLNKLLNKFPSSKGFFTDVVKAVTGLAMVRYLTDPENPKLRYVYATLQAIMAHINEDRRKSVYEIKGYKCKLCGKAFYSKIEVRAHINDEHPFDVKDEEGYEVIPGRKLGEWCRYLLFVEKAGVYGVKNLTKYMRYLLTKGVLIPREGDEVVMDIEGEKYVAVDEGWIRVRERMRELERQLIRGR